MMDATVKQITHWSQHDRDGISVRMRYVEIFCRTPFEISVERGLDSKMPVIMSPITFLNARHEIFETGDC